jgi:predicted RNA-binding protein with PIN domain
MQQELFYVAASRGRSEIAIVTSDREQLQESLGISSARTSAIELAREPMPSVSVEHSITQGISANIDHEIPAPEISSGLEIGLGF